MVVATIGSLVLQGTAPAPALAAKPDPALCQDGFLLAPSGAEAAADCAPSDDGAPALAPLPDGFQQATAISGLTNPTALRFAADGRVFIAEKSGRIKVFDSLSDSTPTIFSDLLTNVHDFWDRGLLGLALDPSLTGGPGGTGSFVYVLYAYNHILGSPDPAPRWEVAGADACPSPPGPTTDGCVVSGRLSRFSVSGTTITGSEQVLVEDWCQQYPSHSVGSLVFGADGALYVSSGDGASFTVVDYGQRGGTSGGPNFPTGKNPCADPPNDSMTPPTAEGGALRSQDMRSTADPASLDGAILRLNPATGAGMPGNPFAGSSNANARRIIAYGLRNPFRITGRPGTNELWVGDVGWNTWEEINRIPNATDGVAENFGWPCYEGGAHQGSYDATNLDLCEDLFDDGPSAVSAPIYAYNHSAKVVTGEGCPTGGSSITGMTFYPEAGGSFNASFRGGLFFADHSRNCIWFIPKGANGQPDPSARQTFVDGAANPVDLVIGPSGDLFYVDLEGGTIRRISPTGPNQPPTADIDANPTSGPAPLTVDFDASGSSDPEGTTLTYQWDLDGDGAYDDATGVTTEWTYDDPGNVTVRLRVTDAGLASDTDTQVVSVSNDPPVPVISTPSAALTWAVGDLINFSGSATDAQDGTLPASALSWTLVLQHCPSNCHSHTVQSWPGFASGSFNGPEHEYPSYLELKLTATDSFGTTATTTRRLDPKTVVLTFRTVPSGLSLGVNAAAATTPFTRTVIVGSDNSVSATSPQTLGGTGYEFSSWSDGLGQSHLVTAPGSNTTYTATYEALVASPLTFTPSADSNIREKKPSKNYGGASILRIRKGQSRTYLKFVVSGLSGAPSDAKLRVWVTNPGSSAGKVYRVGNSWNESSIDWNNAPSTTGGRLSIVGSAPSGTWVEFDLGSVISGNGTYSFAIKGGNSDKVDYSSAEGSMDPILVLTP